MKKTTLTKFSLQKLRKNPGEKKRNHEIFAWFQNLEKKFEIYIFQKKKKFFENRNIFREISSPILEPSKNCIFSIFFLLGIERKSFPEEKIFFPEEEFSGKNQEVARFKNNQTFSPTIQIIFMMAFERSAISSGFNCADAKKTLHVRLRSCR